MTTDTCKWRKYHTNISFPQKKIDIYYQQLQEIYYRHWKQYGINQGFLDKFRKMLKGIIALRWLLVSGAITRWKMGKETRIREVQGM
jgi:hypothetical protein